MVAYAELTPALLGDPVRLAATLATHFFVDKGYDRETIRAVVRTHPQWYADLLARFFLKFPDTAPTLLSASVASLLHDGSYPSYYGWSYEQQSIANQMRMSGPVHFSLGAFRLPERDSFALKQTPIVIAGAGFAGVLITRTLVNAGFSNIRVFDPRGKYGGIWLNPSLALARHTSFPCSYEQERIETLAPGQRIHAVLRRLIEGRPPLPPVEKACVRIRPGQGTALHQVMYQGEGEKEEQVLVPIVVNALGIGMPRPLSQTEKMTTDVDSSQAGYRWQRSISEEEAATLRGKRVVLIGLGESTLTMVEHLHGLRSAGYDIRSTVLTHYPEEAIRFPDCEVKTNNQTYRLFREFSSGHQIAGSLDPIQQTFQRLRSASDAEHIIAGVSHWQVDQEKMRLVFSNGTQLVVPYALLYTLIGYEHSPEAYAQMGVVQRDNHLAVDGDGEFQAVPGLPGRSRLFPGYFGCGAVLSASWQKDASSLPGMLARLPHLFCGITLRALEYGFRQRTSSAK